MADRVAAPRRVEHAIEVAHRVHAPVDTCVGGLFVRGCEVIDDDHLVAGVEQLLDDVGADEPAPTGDEDPHARRAFGSRSVNRAPPFSLATVMSPSCASTKPFAIASPRPAAPVWRAASSW